MSEGEGESRAPRGESKGEAADDCEGERTREGEIEGEPVNERGFLGGSEKRVTGGAREKGFREEGRGKEAGRFPPLNLLK